MAKKVANYFVRDPSILAVVGHNASNASIAARETYKNNKLVMITPTSLSDQLPSESYIFRMASQTDQFARYVKKTYSNSIMGVCIDPENIGNSYPFVKQFYEVFDSDKKILIDLPCDFLDDRGLTEDDLEQKVTEILEEIKQQKINSLVLAPYIDRISIFTNVLQYIRNKNPEIRLYGAPTFFTYKTFREGQAVEGLTLSVPWYPNENESKNLQFQQKFQQLYQAPTENWRTAMAYDATGFIVAGLKQISKQKQPIEREELNNVLSGIEPYPKDFIYDGVTGKTIFDNLGINENKSNVIIQIRDGRFIKINN